MSFPHGGNVYEIASRLGCSPEALLDYSASINPLGPPPGLAEQSLGYFQRLEHYPDIHNTALIKGLADFHRIPEERIVVGNGSTELIYWLPKALGIHRAVLVLPTFSEYRKAFELQGVELQPFLTSPDDLFLPDVEQLDALCRQFRPDAVLFTHPGSPSGTLLTPRLKEWILERSACSGPRKEWTGYCLVDEVFIDFCEEESLKHGLKEASGLVLIRSMTKFYGIPGLRLGYLLSGEPVAERVRRSLPPWSVNTLAQMSGAYCLEQEEYRKTTLEVIERERSRMERRLREWNVGRVLPGRANYLLLELDPSLPSAWSLQAFLLESRRILIRDCSTFEGLGDRYVRFAVRLAEQNDRLLSGIEQWMALEVKDNPCQSPSA